MEDNKKSNKGLIITIIVLIILVLGLGGYIVYDKFLKEELKQEPKAEVVEQVKEVEFCSAENLVKENYLTKMVSSFYTLNDKTVIEIKDGRVLALNADGKSVELQGIEGKAKYVVAFNDIHSDYQTPIYYVLTESGDLYYCDLSKELENKTITLKKINTEKVINIYNSNRVELPTMQNVILSFGFYAELGNGKLIDISNGEFEVENNELYLCTYPDMIYSPLGGDSMKIAFSISVEKKLFLPQGALKENKFKEVKYNNNSIIVKEIFSTCNYSTFEVSYFVITQDNKILKVSENGSTTLYIEKEVQEYKYEIAKNNDKLIITYADGTTETISVVSASTIYYRNMQ